MHNATLISPDKPFSNKRIIRDAIKSCEYYIYWIDKYFSAQGFELLIESLDKNKVKTIKILTSFVKVDSKFRSLFKDFRDEMKNNEVNCELRVNSKRKKKANQNLSPRGFRRLQAR